MNVTGSTSTGDRPKPLSKSAETSSSLSLPESVGKENDESGFAQVTGSGEGDSSTNVPLQLGHESSEFVKLTVL